MSAASTALSDLRGGLAELERAFERHRVPAAGRKLIVGITRGDPVRRVGGGRGNVVVRFVSRKMRRVIQAESRSVELAFVWRCERAEQVVFFYCQPTTLQVSIIDANGRRRVVHYTPDYFVLDADGFAFVECKSEAELKRDAVKPTPRFERWGGGWRWPAAVEAVAAFGVQHRVFSDAEVNGVWERNLRYLDDFVLVPSPCVEQMCSVAQALDSARSLRLEALMALPGVDRETVWWMVAHCRIWCDLEHERVFEPDLAWAHDTEVRMRSHRRLLAEEGAESTDSDGLAMERERLMCRASNAELEEARARWRVLQHFDTHGSLPPETSVRSLYRFRRWAKEGERRYGSAFAGLVRRRGRREGIPGLPEAQAQIVREVVEEYADDRRAGRISSAYSRMLDLCAKRGVSPPPHESTLRRALARLSRPRTERARKGSRAGYQLEGPGLSAVQVIARHGDRPFEVGHIDHTPLDVRLVSSLNGVALGSAWLTVLVDAFSRMPLGVFLSFDAPSRHSVARVIYHCVHRHGRVPDILVLDQGPEFHSHDVETALAHLGVHKVERPARKARYGAVMERLFGVTNTQFVHELTGNTTLVALGRELSSDRHPDRVAVWTLPLLEQACEHWLFGVYPKLVHGTLGARPRDVMAHGLVVSGGRAVRTVACDEALRILLAQTPRGVTRTVDSVRGVTVDYLRFWHDDFQYGDVAGQSVPVKVDAADCAAVFAYVRGRWITCRLADGDADLEGRSWRQIRLAVEELRARRRAGRQAREINGAVIGEFLSGLDVVEQTALARQIARDAEHRQALAVDSSTTLDLRSVASDGILCASDDSGEPSSGSAQPLRSSDPTAFDDDDPDPFFDYDDLEPFDVG